MNNEEEEKRKEKKEWEWKTSVLWLINSCPIPEGFNPCLVSRRIKSALKSSAYSSDRITITAVGNLQDSPDGISTDVLRHLSSTGISLVHSRGIYSQFLSGVYVNKPPATIMLISGAVELESLASQLYDLGRDKYDFLLAYPKGTRTPDSAWLWKSFLRSVPQEWIWETLLEGSKDDDLETRISEMDESTFSCSLCPFSSQNIEDFIKHLSSVNHAYLDRNMVGTGTGAGRMTPYQLRAPRTIYKPVAIDFASLMEEELRLKRKPNEDPNED